MNEVQILFICLCVIVIVSIIYRIWNYFKKDTVYLLYRPNCRFCTSLKKELWPMFGNYYGYYNIKEYNVLAGPAPDEIVNAFDGVLPPTVPFIFKIKNGKAQPFYGERTFEKLKIWAESN